MRVTSALFFLYMRSLRPFLKVILFQLIPQTSFPSFFLVENFRICTPAESCYLLRVLDPGFKDRNRLLLENLLHATAKTGCSCNLMWLAPEARFKILLLVPGGFYFRHSATISASKHIVGLLKMLWDPRKPTMCHYIIKEE